LPRGVGANAAPTESGFGKWLCGQKPQWPHKVQQNFDVQGYELDGKFLTVDEATKRGRENPELLIKFRKATKSDDKIRILGV